MTLVLDAGRADPTPRRDAERLLMLAASRPADALAEADRLLGAGCDAHDASIAHQARANVLRDVGRLDEAVAELRTALRFARASLVSERVIDVQATLGVALVFAGRTAAGLASMDEAVAGGTGVVAGRVLTRRGGLLRLLGRHAEALADLKRAIDLLHRGGDTIWEARSRNHRFLVYSALGQAGSADRDLAVAERLFAAAGQELESAMAVHSRADVAFQAGDLPAALGFLDEAAARYAAAQVSVPGLARDRCAVLLAAGLPAEALEQVDEAIRRLGPSGEQGVRRAELLFAAARAALAAGEHGVAKEKAAAVLGLFRAQHHRWWQARASFVVLQSRYDAGEGGGRLRSQASRLADTLEALGAEEAPTAHLLAGRLAAQQGRPVDADRHFLRAARFRYRGPTFGRAAGWLAQALRAEAQGSTQGALMACRRGLAAAAEHQRMLGAPELRALATAYGTELASIAQRHAVLRRDARMLLLWTERWRASALAVPPVRPPDDHDLAADLAALRNATRRLDDARAAGSATARLEQDQRRLEASIQSRTRRTAGIAALRTSSSLEIEEILGGLDGHTLIELVALDDTLYAVTATGRRVRLYAVGPTAVAEREVNLTRFMLRRLAHGRPAAGALAALNEAGRRLEEALLGPVASDLDGGPVVVVPPGRLHAVPWALLPSLRKTPVKVAPSAGTWLRAGWTPPPNGRVAFVVGPGLNGSAAEVTKIARSYPDTVVLADGDATADRALHAIDGAWTAHIAAHGVFRADNPLFSSLLLADGPLTLYDLGRLGRAPLRLVLSSCESAVSAHVGDELLGMVSALVPLGTASLLASVVPVNDAATVAVMVAFHDHLHTGSSFADALLAAQEYVADDPVAFSTAASFIALGR